MKDTVLKRPFSPLLAVGSSVEGILWPPLQTGQAATLTALLHYFEASQWLPAHIIEQRQHKQLALLAAYAAKHSAHFRARLEQAGLKVADLATPEGLRRLPLLTRRDIQTSAAAMHCDKAPASHGSAADAKTSGSTGEPVVVKKTAVTGLFWHASMMREHFWHRRNFAGGVINIRGLNKEVKLQKTWGAPVSLLYPSGDVLSLPTTLKPREYIDKILEFKPRHLLLYPNTLETIVKQCEQDGIAVKGVEHIWSIGEALKPEVRQKAAELFGASIEDDYSSNEIGIMALQCPQSGLLHVMAENVLLEVLDEQGQPCPPGAVGKVVVTDLHNFAMPMIRYVIGDYAEVGPPCPCGRGLPTLKAVRGRLRNLAITPDGSRHWPPLTSAVFRSGVPISQFQVIQHSLEEVEVRLVVPQPLTPEQESILTTHFQGAMAHPFNIRFTYFDDRIPLGANGKFEDFICRVQQ